MAIQFPANWRSLSVSQGLSLLLQCWTPIDACHLFHTGVVNFYSGNQTNQDSGVEGHCQQVRLLLRAQRYPCFYSLASNYCKWARSLTTSKHILLACGTPVSFGAAKASLLSVDSFVRPPNNLLLCSSFTQYVTTDCCYQIPPYRHDNEGHDDLSFYEPCGLDWKGTVDTGNV